MSLEKAKAAMKAHDPEVGIREANGKLIYSVKGVDLLEHQPGSPSYRLLRDFPRFHNKAGQMRHLSPPFDESIATTARDLAAEVRAI